jgi:hypothetical protein
MLLVAPVIGSTLRVVVASAQVPALRFNIPLVHDPLRLDKLVSLQGPSLTDGNS